MHYFRAIHQHNFTISNTIHLCPNIHSLNRVHGTQCGVNVIGYRRQWIQSHRIQKLCIHWQPIFFNAGHRIHKSSYKNCIHCLYPRIYCKTHTYGSHRHAAVHWNKRLCLTSTKRRRMRKQTGRNSIHQWGDAYN